MKKIIQHAKDLMNGIKDDFMKFEQKAEGLGYDVYFQQGYKEALFVSISKSEKSFTVGV